MGIVLSTRKALVSIVPEPDFNTPVKNEATVALKTAEIGTVQTLAEDKTISEAIEIVKADIHFDDHVQHETGLVFKESTTNSTNLFAAIKLGQLDKVMTLIESGNNLVSSSGMWSSTPLIIACQYNHTDIALFLAKLSSVQILNHSNEKGASALLYCCLEESMIEVTKYLMEKHIHINTLSSIIYNSKFDRTMSLCCLSACVINNNVPALQLIMPHFPLNTVLSSPFGKGLLVVSGLTNKNASTAGAVRLTPLMLACTYGRMSIVELYIQQLTITTPSTKQAAPSSSSSSHCNDAISTAIMNHPVLAAFDFMDEFGCTVFHHISKSLCNDDETVLKMLTFIVDCVLSIKLMEFGISNYDILCSMVNAQDNQGNSALHYLCDNKYVLSIQYILSLMNNDSPVCDADIQNDNGVTALYVAIKKRCELAVVCLLQYAPMDDVNAVVAVSNRKPASPCLCDINGLSSVDLAQKLRNDSVIYKAVDWAIRSHDFHIPKEEGEEFSESFNAAGLGFIGVKLTNNNPAIPENIETSVIHDAIIHEKELPEIEHKPCTPDLQTKPQAFNRNKARNAGDLKTSEDEKATSEAVPADIISDTLELNDM